MWGAGITYRRSREYYSEHDTGQAHRGKGIYDYVYEAERPELFYKGSAARSVGPHGAVGLRGDSKLTAVEAELAVVVGVGGGIVGYTVGNDLSAWDIERENPLFLPQSKIFQGSFAFGPVIATPASIPDPHALTIRCVIERGGRTLFEGQRLDGRSQAPRARSWSTGSAATTRCRRARCSRPAPASWCRTSTRWRRATS